MQLSQSQIESFDTNGYLLLEDLFTPAEVNSLQCELPNLMAEDCPRRILEKNGTVRSFFAPDHTQPLFRKITRDKRLVAPAMALLGSKIYIHQTKINSKHALVGDWWEWHQDYVFWKKDDGMPGADVLTAMIFLNEVNEYNGPMLLIPGSHKEGVVDATDNGGGGMGSDGGWYQQYNNSVSYMSALTSNLKYTLKQQLIRKWAERNGIFSAKGPAGSVLFFHGNVFHASSNNLSPWDRHTFLVTYNSISNTLAPIDHPRPEFIANRNFEPVEPA